jgi:diguanylate cyclase (GGDEF)-like protein/PAS domain S-box-containing protein
MSQLALEKPGMKRNSKYQIFTFVSMFLSMFVFESLQQIFLPNLSDWQASSITIVLSSTLALACALIILHKDEENLYSEFKRQNDMISHELEKSHTFYQQIIDIDPNLIYIRDKAGRYILVNQALANFYGVARFDLIGKTDEHFNFDADQVASIRRSDQQILYYQQEKILPEEVLTDAYGKMHWLRTLKRPITSLNEVETQVLGVSEDICQVKRYEEKLNYERMHDPLTGLPNQVLIKRQVEDARVHNDTNEHLFAVLLMDIDQLKRINEMLGYAVGDQLIVALSKRLESCVRSTDTIARLKSDEFAILLQDLNEIDEAQHVVERIFEKISRPFMINDHELRVTASIGIVYGTNGEQNFEDFIRHAAIALKKAKDQGKSVAVIYNDEMRQVHEDILQLENDLRKAVENGELRLHYQPIIALKDQQVCGVEALVRWQHPERGLLYPMEFIHLAEEHDLIVPIGYWVLHEACLQMKSWQESYPRINPLTISVNISCKQLLYAGFVQQVAHILEESQLSPQYLKLEITESVYLEQSEEVESVLKQLHELGVRLFIDDFGTGYSSFSYLRNIPFDAIKIDRSFIEGVIHRSGDMKIVEAIVRLARDLGKELVAEGVETEEQRQWLHDLGCEFEQGFLFSRPMEAEDVEHFFHD